ncbi:MAG: hypothetical protein Q4G34_00490 [Micrococcus sp.]|nr:hypothetical protein [Micrococcus sp.]
MSLPPTPVAAGDTRWSEVARRRRAQQRAQAPGRHLWDDAEAGPLQQRRPRTGLDVLLGAALMLSIGVPLPLVGGAPLGDLAVFALIVLAVLRRPVRDAQLLQAGVLLAILVLLAMSVASGLQGIDELAILRRLVRIAALGTLVLMCASGRVDLRAILHGAALTLLINIPLFYAGLLPRPYDDYLTGLVDDKNVAGFLYAVLPVLLVATLRSVRAKVVVLGAGAVPVYLTGSRTAIAAYACAVLWLLIAPRLRVAARLLLVGVMGIVVSYAEENFAQIGVFASRTGTDWLRDQIHEASWEKTLAAPWHGYGVGTATVEVGFSRWFYHQSYLGLWTEGGFIFFAAVLAAYLVFGLRPFSRSVRSPSRVAVEAATVVVLVVATQLGETFLSIGGALVLAAGAVLLVAEHGTPPTDAERRRRAAQLRMRAQRAFTTEDGSPAAALRR